MKQYGNIWCIAPDTAVLLTSEFPKSDVSEYQSIKLYWVQIVCPGCPAWLQKIAEMAGHEDLTAIARRAFIAERGAALCKKHAALSDPLFTPPGFITVQRPVQPAFVQALSSADLVFLFGSPDIFACNGFDILKSYTSPPSRSTVVAVSPVMAPESAWPAPQRIRREYQIRAARIT